MPYRAQLDPINLRLHARLHQKAIAAVDREESCAEVCDRIARKYARQVIAALPQDERHSPALHRIRAAAAGFWPEIARTIHQQLAGMAQWSHQASVAAYLDVIPPRWFRAIVPQLPLTESIGDLPPPFTDFPPDIGFPIAQSPEVPSEPDKKKNPDDDFTRPLSGDDEYQDAVRQLLFPPLDLNTINRIIYTPTDGVGWPARLSKWSTKFANPDALAANLATGLSQGQDLGELSRGVRDTFGMAGSTAKRVARSEAHRVNLMAHDEASKGLGDLKAGSMYQAQLDFNTRPTHAIHHGQIFKVGEPWPLTLSESNCRCSMLDVLSDPSDIESDPNVAAEFANTAKEEIPDPAAYHEWFQRAPEQDRRLAVGTKRYEAVRNIAKYANRKPEWTDFLDGESGQLMSPQNIQAETVAQRAVRKAAVGKLIQQRADDYRSVRNLGFVLQRQQGG